MKASVVAGEWIPQQRLSHRGHWSSRESLPRHEGRGERKEGRRPWEWRRICTVARDAAQRRLLSCPQDDMRNTVSGMPGPLSCHSCGVAQAGCERSVPRCVSSCVNDKLGIVTSGSRPTSRDALSLRRSRSQQLGGGSGWRGGATLEGGGGGLDGGRCGDGGGAEGRIRVLRAQCAPTMGGLEARARKRAGRWVGFRA